METIQPHSQEQPAQHIAPNVTQPERQTTEHPALRQEQQATQPTERQPAQPTKPLYNPAETAQIVKHLTEVFAPEYILLFGKLAGGTPHSDATAYDLLMVVRESPEYDWIEAKRILRYKMPVPQREIPYFNLYILPLNFIESHRTPFLHFAHAEGVLLFCSDSYHFRRPKHPLDFARAYADGKFQCDTFLALGDELIRLAQQSFEESRNLRLAAQFAAQAAVYYYHTLYYAYHGQVFESHDPVVMHERMRPLSTRLMLTLDDTHLAGVSTLACLKNYLRKAPYDLHFYIPPQELETNILRVLKMGRIIGNHTRIRLNLYKELNERP